MPVEALGRERRALPPLSLAHHMPFLRLPRHRDAPINLCNGRCPLRNSPGLKNLERLTENVAAGAPGDTVPARRCGHSFRDDTTVGQCLFDNPELSTYSDLSITFVLGAFSASGLLPLPGVFVPPIAGTTA